MWPHTWSDQCDQTPRILLIQYSWHENCQKLQSQDLMWPMWPHTWCDQCDQNTKNFIDSIFLAWELQTTNLWCTINNIVQYKLWPFGDSSISRRVKIPNGFYSERYFVLFCFFYIYNLKGSLFWFFLSRRVIFPKIFIPKGHYSEFWNNDPSG